MPGLLQSDISQSQLGMEMLQKDIQQNAIDLPAQEEDPVRTADFSATAKLMQAAPASGGGGNACSKLSDADKQALKTPVSNIVTVGALVLILFGVSATQLISMGRYRADPNLMPRSPKLLALSCVWGVLVSLLVMASTFVGGSFDLVLGTFLWSMNFAAPLKMAMQWCRMSRLIKLCKLHAKRVEWSSAVPVYTKPSLESVQAPNDGDAMFRARDALLDFERQLTEARPSTREKHFFQLLLVGAAICAGASCAVQLAVPQCTLFDNAVVGIAAASLLPTLLSLAQVWQCFQLRAEQEAFMLKIEFALITAVNVAYILSQVIGGLLLANGKATLVLLIQAHAVSTATWLLISAVVPLSCMHFSLRKGKVRYIQNFDDFFAVPISRQFFAEYLAMELHSELFLFWEDVEAFKSISDSSSSEAAADAQSRLECMARNLHAKYIRAGSLMDVQLDGVLRQEVAFRVNTSIVTKTVFDGTQAAVAEKLQSTYIRFLRHPISAHAMQSYLRKVLDQDY